MNKISYQNPPLNELVFGVQFSPKHISPQEVFSYYSNYLNSDFPKIQENEPLPISIESPNKLAEFSLTSDLSTRKLFFNNENEILIQVQSNKFFLNWRRQKDKEYPHFDNVYSNFKKRLDELFLVNDQLKNSINQYEITYVDHFQSDSFNERNFQLSNVFNFFQLSESLSTFNFAFSIPQSSLNGNLNVTIRSAKRNSDQKPIVVMHTTCRGFSKELDFDSWFQQARKILFEFFEKNLTEELKKSWVPIEK